MTIRPIALATLATLFLVLPGCGGGGDAEPKEEGVFGRLSDMAEAASTLEEKANQFAEEGPTEPIDFRQLRDLLPAEALGFAQSDAAGSKDGAMGFSVSKASAKYTNDETNAELALTDLGGAQFAMMMGLAWTMAAIDRETATGFERTQKFDDQPGYAEYDSERRSGKIQILVAERFLIEASGNGVTFEQLEELAGTINKGKLDSWKDEGRGANPPAPAAE